MMQLGELIILIDSACNRNGLLAKHKFVVIGAGGELVIKPFLDAASFEDLMVESCGYFYLVSCTSFIKKVNSQYGE